MKAGKNLIPASRMATTKGLAAAFAALRRNHLVSALLDYRSEAYLPLVGTGQGSRVGRDKQTNNEDSTNVEHQDSPEGALDSPGNRFPWVSRLTDCCGEETNCVSDSFQWIHEIASPVTPINSVPMYAKRALGMAYQTPRNTPTSFW